MKRIYKIIALFIIIISCSACAKDETIMTINNDKSLNIEVNLGYPVGSTKIIDIAKLKDNAGSIGYFVDSYHDNMFSGYRLSKKIKNINDVSTKENINLNLADIITGKIDDSKLFKVDKGFFKNTYYANFTYDFKEIYQYTPKIYLFGSELNSNTSDIKNYINEYIKKKNYNIELVEYEVLTNPDNFNIMNNTITNLNETYKGIPIVIINDKIINYNENIKDSIALEIDNIFNTGIYSDVFDENLDTSYELTYVVNLPSRAISNNATTSTDDNKTLIWTCNYFSDNKIEYSFSMFNISSIIIIIISITTLIVSGIVGFILYNKIKKDKEKFIAKNTNISNILPQVDESNQITSINDLIGK